jgi:hypothetical protein
MTYDPQLDEPRYSQREMEQAVTRAVHHCFTTAFNAALDVFAASPLEVFGAWEPDRVYPPHALVFHGGTQWLALGQTTGEPGRNGSWRQLGNSHAAGGSTTTRRQ